jgi:DNA-binding CsgD family transcriptional regulator
VLVKVNPPTINWAQADKDLTPRERQILDLWNKGLGIKRTRLLLGLSESTIRTHRARIKEKLGKHVDDVNDRC